MTRPEDCPRCMDLYDPCVNMHNGCESCTPLPAECPHDDEHTHPFSCEEDCPMTGEHECEHTDRRHMEAITGINDNYFR